MARLDDLQRVEKAIVRIARIGAGREAARNRAERSGVHLSRPAINLISALHAAGPMRLSRLSDLTDLEAPRVSREIARLCEGGYVKRTPDPRVSDPIAAALKKWVFHPALVNNQPVSVKILLGIPLT